MDPFWVTGDPLRRNLRLYLGILLLAVAQILLANGQQAGVSLMLSGVAIPNDGFVDIDDVLSTAGGPGPTNTNSNGAVLCITDLVGCCISPIRGDWYFPNGERVGESGNGWVVNRGASDQQTSGSVRLFRRFSAAPGRGRFRCEIPNAADVDQIIYLNILNFGVRFDVDHVTFSPSTGSTTTTAGQTDYSLNCSSILTDPVSLPSGVPMPMFQWLFDGSTSLPFGVTAMPTVMSSSNSFSETYTSTLQFSPLSQSHAGMYICRLGPGRLENSVMVTVIAPAISVQITASGTPMLGQSYSLTCAVTGVENLDSSITYQWTQNNGTQTPVPNGDDPKTLSFSTLRLSDAGRYTCQATVSSPYLSNDITMMDTQDVRIQIPAPTVTLSSSIPNPIPPFGSNVTLICAVELSPAVDVPVTVNTVLTTPVGFMRASTVELVMGSSTNYASTFMISSFGRSDSGSYVCSSTIRLSSTNAYISDSSGITHALIVTTGVYLSLRGVHITNNNNINIRNIGQSSDSPNGALQCITDNLRCCSQNPQRGEWYQPNRTLVQGDTSTTAFYRTRGANGEVSLNRPSGVESPTGQFCCEVPDATNTNQTLCVNIGGITFSIPSDPPIAGESYTLECSAGGSEGTFQWLKGPPDGRTPVVTSGSVTISSTSTSSQLQFRPVQQSDNGSYSCNATTNGLTFSSESMMISVNAPPVSVQISDSGSIPTSGQNYQLICDVSGAENLNPTTTYRWTRNSGSGQTQVGDTLSFTPLRLADAASYVCGVTISSNYLTGDIAAMNINTQNISIQIPTPSSLMLTSNSGNPDDATVVVGSDLTLTCTLVLNSAIMGSENALLMVEAQLSRNGTSLAIASRSIAGTTFTYTTQLSSFGRSDSGNYTCTATVRPQPTTVYLTGNEILSSNINLRAVSSPPLNVQATQSGSSATVEVSWSPPSDGSNSITGYRIFYGNGQNVFVPSVTAITLVGLKVDGSYVDQNVSIRSESDQLYSELINVSVINIGNSELCAPIMDKALLSRSCTSEIGIAVGAVIVVECVIVIVITVIVVLCLWRKKLSTKNKNDSSGNDFAVSANMAYGEVTLKPVAGGVDGGEYENPDKILRTEASTYEPIHSSKPEASEYASVEDTVGTTN